MKLALIGYGKIGKTIERIGLEMGHEIHCRIDSEEDWDDFGSILVNADVAIEFSTPHTVYNNVKRCLEAAIPVVTGTTGWDEMKPVMKRISEEKGGTVVSASNFSLGVNLFFLINKYAANLMKPFTGYDVKIEEIHHLQKLDAPSGTAKVIAEDVLRIYNHKSGWVNHAVDRKDLLAVESKREGDVKGEHTVTFYSDLDEITLKHSAKTRDGFAKGALLAATWVVGKKGWFTMEDVLKGMIGYNSGV